MGNVADEPEQLYRGYMQKEMVAWNIELGAQLDAKLSEKKGKWIFAIYHTFRTLEIIQIYVYMGIHISLFLCVICGRCKCSDYHKDKLQSREALNQEAQF